MSGPSVLDRCDTAVYNTLMRAEIVSIGTELLLGHTVDTNSAYISQKLAELGIDVYHHTTVGDNPQRLADTVRRGLHRANLVIMSGGLGPTVDDITIETLSKFSGVKTAKTIKNRVGTAPGIIIENDDRAIICLPGPPRELVPMFENDIAPYLKKICTRGSIIRSRTIRITGLSESHVNDMVKDILMLKPPTTVGIYAKLGEVDLKIMSKADSAAGACKSIKKIEGIIYRRLKNNIFGYDNDTLESAVGDALRKKRLTIAIAESCTGGLISSRITDVSGSSEYFLAGITAYSNPIKEKVLGVKSGLIKKYGAVSRQVALGMAIGARTLCDSDIGVGVTGIAGPKGDTKSKPVGLVYISLVYGRKRIVKKYNFHGSRQDIKFRASQAALNLIRRCALS